MRIKIPRSIFFLGLCLLSFTLLAEEVIFRDQINQFPRCVETNKKDQRLFFSWTDEALTRKILIAHVDYIPCEKYAEILSDKTISWMKFNPKKYPRFSDSLLNELKQVEEKGNILRAQSDLDEFLSKNPIEKYTLAVNKELTKKYGQLFSARVFRKKIEEKPENKEFLNKVLADLSNKKLNIEAPFKYLDSKVRLVVSFGLGWEEKYGRTVPYYIEDFLSEMKGLGLPVTFIKKDPFGTVEENVQKMLPGLREALLSGEDLIFVSLCKGTPELLRAEAELMKHDEKNRYGKILGHINLSGMLSGAIFSDFAREVVLPKVVAPLLKLIPLAAVRDNAKMVDAIEYMKTSIIEENLKASKAHLDKDIFYVNITGAPMTNLVLEGSSPMKPIVKYGSKTGFIESANDGFLEMPNTLIPESISKNQVTLVLDATHILSDGDLHGFKISDKRNRRALYYSVLKTVIEKSRPEYMIQDGQ